MARAAPRGRASFEPRLLRTHCRVGPPGSDAHLVDVDGTWTRYHRIGENGAVLVRPDGHVCWRAFGGPDGHAGVGLGDALDIALGRRLPGALLAKENRA